MGTKKIKSVKKVQRIKTKQSGVYKNSVTNKYDVKYCYTIVDMATSKKKYMQKWCYGMLGYPKYEEYALAKNSEFFERTETFNPDLDASVKLVRIQKWKYNPRVLAIALDDDFYSFMMRGRKYLKWR